MQLKYGTYTHQLGECAVTIRHDAIVGQEGYVVGAKHSWGISGALIYDTQDEVTTAIAALKTAYSQNFGDLILLDNSGNPTAHALYNSQTDTGVRVVSLSFPEGMGGEYTTYRTFEIQVEGTIGSQTPGGSTGNLAFSQTISQRGTGGPRKVIRQTLTGYPVVQYVSQRTPIYTTQSGSARGYGTYPVPPPPIAPQWEDLEQRTISRDDAASGPFGQRIFSTAWSYQFSSPF